MGGNRCGLCKLRGKMQLISRQLSRRVWVLQFVEEKKWLFSLRLGVGRRSSRGTVDTAGCFMVLVSSGSSC